MSMHSDASEYQQRSKAEQQLQENVIRLVEQHMLQQNDVEVFTNPGNIQGHPLISENEETLFPDLFTKVDDRLTTVCAVETLGTVSVNSIEKWQSYSDVATTFLLVVPEQCVDLAKVLLNENNIDYDKIMSYQGSSS